LQVIKHACDDGGAILLEAGMPVRER